MATSFTFFILFLASTLFAINITHATSTVAKDLVPCTMCAECENPCQPLPPPPPPVVDCPPPPLPSPPPPAAVAIECPPPPKIETPCPDNCEVPQGPVVPRPPYPPAYFPPGTPYPIYVPDNMNNSGGKTKPLQAMLFSLYFTKYLIYVPCLLLVYLVN